MQHVPTQHQKQSVSHEKHCETSKQLKQAEYLPSRDRYLEILKQLEKQIVKEEEMKQMQLVLLLLLQKICKLKEAEEKTLEQESAHSD